MKNSMSVQAGKLPFSNQEWIPAVNGFLPLFAHINPLLAQKEHALVALEGGSASGKTTLSQLLAEVYDCAVFHMDDFFLRPEQRTPERLSTPGGNVDWERFEQEVLIPIKQKQPVNYRRYDCHAAAFLPPTVIRPQKLNIIEGAYSMHPSLAGYYDLAVFLQVEPSLQRQRIQKRNSPQMAKRFFQEWIPLETQYFQMLRPQERCNLTLTAEAER